VTQAINDTKPSRALKIVPDASFQKLRRYDSATVANVIELFQIRPSTFGYLRGSIRAIYPDLPPVVGYATTATFRSNFPSDDPSAYLRVPEHLNLMRAFPEPRIAVVQDLDDPTSGATLGEVMCRVYKRFGCAAIITSGAARDILAVRDLNFAVFASSIIVGHGYPRLESLHVPVYLNGVTINPGDIIHADANGVLVIPNDIAEQVADACEEFVGIEKKIMQYLDLPEATIEGYLESEEVATKEFDDLAARLRSQMKRA
jgi:4-hydroxy-4-methyl-2-oxoglutarate aldolase